MKVVIALVCIFAFTAAQETEVKQEFAKFLNRFSKKYEDKTEFMKRYNIFKTNYAKVQQLNNEVAAQNGGAAYGVTKFMDLSEDEFANYYLGRKGPIREDVPYIGDVSGFDAPSSFDWRSQNVITPVYNQGQCGDCWAFSAVEEVESQYALAGNPLTKLSIEQIVDCDGQDDGCNGGDTVSAYAYIEKAGGLESYADYPGLGKSQQCKFDPSEVVASISGYSYVTQPNQKNETQMMYALPQVGPFSICVDAASWQFYTSGVITSHCGQQLDHCVMITGYNSGASTPYWIIRNSWGTDWGLEGYLWVGMGQNLCGVADEVTIVQISN